MKTLLLLVLTCGLAFAGEENVTHRVTGLFSPAREADLRTAIAQLPGVNIVSVDFDRAEIVFRYDPAAAFKGTPAEPAKIMERFHNELSGVSHGTFGIAQLIDTPREKLTRIEVPAGGCDCKACALAAYESVFKIEGVAAAAVDFKQGRISALIDPAKTNSAALEEALKQRGVEIRKP